MKNVLLGIVAAAIAAAPLAAQGKKDEAKEHYLEAVRIFKAERKGRDSGSTAPQS